MRNPRVIDPLRLLQPRETSGGGGDDVESAIAIEICELEVEPGRSGTKNTDGMLAKAETPVFGVLEEEQPVFATAPHDDVKISVTIEIDRFRVLRHAEAP